MPRRLLRVPSVRQWGAPSNLEQGSISILGWNKIIVASNNGSIPCVVLDRLKRQHASVVTRDKLRHSLRPRRSRGEVVSLLEQRPAFLQRLTVLLAEIPAVSQFNKR